MRRFFARVGRFFWSWGFLKVVLWMVTIVVLFYVEEDWRGARAWAAVKKEWEAKGESFDFARMIPPPVPDEKNLAAIPLFKMEPDVDSNGDLEPLTLRASVSRSPSNQLPHLGNYYNGEISNGKKIDEDVATLYAGVFKAAPTSTSALDQFGAIYPFVGDLRKAAETRPFCSLEQNYIFAPPYNLYIPLITGQVGVSRIVTVDAVIALNEKKPDVALADIKINLRLAAALTRQPLYVSGLVAIGLVAIGDSALYDGLALHAWNDAQLADLQSTLAEIDFLSAYRRGYIGQMTGVALPGYDSLKANRAALTSELKLQRDADKSNAIRYDVLAGLWPGGWIDLNKTQAFEHMILAVDAIDVKKRLVLPRTGDGYVKMVDQNEHRWDATVPWRVLSSGHSLVSGAAQKFAFAQVRIDEARIACGLERYRLVHKAYPETLDALVPACMDELPHDVMSGQPYVYRLGLDGTFLLYSVGWNQTDEGGKMAYKSNGISLDYDAGDWVWPMPQAVAK